MTAPSKTLTRILVVDDEPQILRTLRINLRVRQYEVFTAASATEALTVAATYLSETFGESTTTSVSAE